MEKIFENNNSNSSFPGKLIIIAGATGHLGSRICHHLLERGANVTALVRRETKREELSELMQQGLQIAEVDFDDHQQLTKACSGATCFISALSGVRDVIVDLQNKLLDACVDAKVPRFIPSDYCIDYTKLEYGTNRNLDLRREFNERLDKSLIQATSILNGMFTDLLKGQAPLILYKFNRILYWGDDRQLLDFTSMENTAEYTALAAMDDSTPRYLRIAGEVTNVIGLKDSASRASGETYKTFRAGGLGMLKTMIRITRFLAPAKKEVFPPWQGMQYLHNMFSGLPKLDPLDNERYPGIRWTSVKEVISEKF